MTIQEQAINYLRGLEDALGPQLLEEAITLVPNIPTSLVDMPYCPICESVRCSACGHCHSFLLFFWCNSHDRVCPLDHDDMGHRCATWWIAFRAVVVVQRMQEEE